MQFIQMKNLSAYQKGKVFWYKYLGRCFGAVVLDYQQKHKLYLIALSEQLFLSSKSKEVPSLEKILAADLYTVAWFDDFSLLNPLRIHSVGMVDTALDFSGKAGLRCHSNGSFELYNVGQMSTWKHTYTSLRLRECKILDVLSDERLPNTWQRD